MNQPPRRRSLYMLAILIGLPVLALTWWTQQGADPVARYATPLLAGYLTCAFLALWRNALPVPRVERLTFAVLTLLWLGRYAGGFHDPRTLGAGWAQFVITVMLNFLVLAVLAHLVLSTRAGLRANLAVVTVSLLIGLAHLLPDALQGVHRQALAQLLQFHGAYAVVVGFVWALAKSKDDYLTAELQARELRVIAYRDVLTDLPNRRRLAEELERQIELSRRYLRPLSLILFDLDHFKRINDTHGHATGDAVLVSVTRAVEPLLRASDTFGRWGGEEFLVVAPETDIDDAQALAERIRGALKDAEHPDETRVTASFGVTTRAEGVTASDLLAEADRHLYEAKRQGRDRVSGGA